MDSSKALEHFNRVSRNLSLEVDYEAKVDMVVDPKSLPSPSIKLKEHELKLLFKSELERLELELRRKVQLEVTTEIKKEFDRKLALAEDASRKKNRLLDESKQQFESVISELMKAVKTTIDEGRAEADRAAVELAYYAVLELVTNPEMYSELVKGSIAKQLELIKYEDEAVIKCAQHDYMYIQSALPIGNGIKVVESDKVAPGCYVLETSMSIFKVGLADQVSKLHELFFSHKAS